MLDFGHAQFFDMLGFRACSIFMHVQILTCFIFEHVSFLDIFYFSGVPKYLKSLIFWHVSFLDMFNFLHIWFSDMFDIRTCLIVENVSCSQVLQFPIDKIRITGTDIKKIRSFFLVMSKMCRGDSYGIPQRWHDESEFGTMNLQKNSTSKSFWRIARKNQRGYREKYIR